MGGLPRRDTFLRSLGASGPVFLVDNGDVNTGYGRQPEMKYETAMKAIAEMGYRAVNVGERDLVLGLDYLKYVADFTGVPLVSANIVSAGGEPLFRPFVLHEMQVGKGKLKWAAIGVISTDFKEEIESTNPGIVVEDYDARLEELIKQLSGQAGFMVLLAHMSEDEAQTIAERFPLLDLIIVSHAGDDPYAVPITIGDVPIVFAGARGMHVGVARFEVSDDEARLSAYSAEKLDGKLNDSPAMQVLITDYQQMLKAERLLDRYPRVRHETAGYVGNTPCQDCHENSFARFQDDKHAHAFDSLVAKGHEYDPECVGCHSVGFGYVSGFVSPEATPGLKDVGCENCHGPAANHIENPLEEEYGGIEKQTCQSCHNIENSPKFVFDEWIKRIDHKDEGSTVAG